MSQAGGQIVVHDPAVWVTYIRFLKLVWSSLSGTSNFVKGSRKNNAFKGGAGSIQPEDPKRLFG